MTALILATKSHFSFWGSRIVLIRREILTVGGRFDDSARERMSFFLLFVTALLLFSYVVSVNIILGEGGRIGLFERAIREERIILLDKETAFAAQSSVEQLKKYDTVRRMVEVGTVQYVQLNSPALVDANFTNYK